ncbi:MAG: nucleotidyltransferase family protein [Gammaproteobacteria bacterium]|nr:nucleotidyltransferase family protein [Gammaproteobacteria bacterium]
MKAIILAAGKGERLRPITNQIPKPLISLGSKTLLGRNIESLYLSGIREIIVNSSWLTQQIEVFLSTINYPNLKIIHLYEGKKPLGTAGAIINAIDYLKDDFFWVVNSDILTNFSFKAINTGCKEKAHLILVPNPEHNPEGDFGLKDGIVCNHSDEMYTFSGISILSPDMFKSQEKKTGSLAVILRAFVEKNMVTGDLFSGEWLDVGTLERLNKARNKIQIRN